MTLGFNPSTPALVYFSIFHPSHVAGLGALYCLIVFLGSLNLKLLFPGQSLEFQDKCH